MRTRIFAILKIGDTEFEVQKIKEVTDNKRQYCIQIKPHKIYIYMKITINSLIMSNQN